MPIVDYWGVNSNNSQTLSWTASQICNALIADWFPNLPIALGRSMLGWPHLLIGPENTGRSSYLSLVPYSGFTDRQWKGILSWMIGVAGTRRVLAEDNYTWIAPSSAFYPNRQQPVNFPNWPLTYPPLLYPLSTLTIEKDPGSSSRLRPDYIAARVNSNRVVEFSMVEGKGTSMALSSLSACPRHWASQARNAIVKLNGIMMTIPRNLVIATRCNPNGKRARTRRLQVRAWNSKRISKENYLRALSEIVCAHYSGLCRNLGLWNNEIAIHSFVRLRQSDSTWPVSALKEIREAADRELMELADWQISSQEPANLHLALDVGKISVQLYPEAISIIRLCRTNMDLEELAKHILAYDSALKLWFRKMSHEYQDNDLISVDRSGYILKIEKFTFAWEKV